MIDNILQTVKLKKFGRIQEQGHWSYFILTEDIFSAAVSIRPGYSDQKNWRQKESKLLIVSFNEFFNKTEQNPWNGFKKYGNYFYDAKKTDEFAYNFAKTIAERTASFLQYEIKDLTLEEPLFPIWKPLTQRIIENQIKNNSQRI